jgi:hypothetical protein
MIRNLYTTSSLLIARGYDRVEVGDRGPYVEFNLEQIVHDSIHRIHAAHYYFDEYRSNCPSNVMVYLQRMPVSNANYVIGKYYISSSDLRDENGREVPELFADPSNKQGSFPF